MVTTQTTITNALLTIEGNGGAAAEYVAAFLQDLVRAYGVLAAFERTVNRLQTFNKLTNQLATSVAWVREREAARREQVEGLVSPYGTLVLQAAQLSSPGFWAFLGALNPLEVFRMYLNDRHQRRKDRTYREADEAQRNDLENQLLAIKVLNEKIQVARGIGATDDDLAPLLTDVLKALRALGKYQDSGLIEAASLEELSEPANRRR